MEQVFVVNPKGGCGKTTISTQLAAHFSQSGQRVLLVDHDALKCSSDWLAGRPKGRSPIASLIAPVNAPVTASDVDWVVHDMPAAWTLDNVQDIIHRGDFVLIPVLSSPNDIKACLRFVMQLHRSGVLETGVKVGLIANRARTNTRYFKVLLAFLERLNLPIVGVLRDTQNYIRVMDQGLSIFDLAVSQVKYDIEQWEPIIHWLRQLPVSQSQSVKERELEPMS